MGRHRKCRPVQTIFLDLEQKEKPRVTEGWEGMGEQSEATVGVVEGDHCR